MIKIFTLLNVAGLLLFELLFGSDISVSHDLPTTMAPGSEVKVTVTIDKQQTTGFAKLQIDLPEGFSASAIETKGASFTFADGKAKFIWMALPSQPSFKVSYTLSVAATATGTLPVTGKFSYIEDNERKTKDLPSTTVTITGGAVADAPMTPPAIDAPSTADDVVSASGSMSVPQQAQTSTAPNTLPLVPSQQGAGNVSGKRTVTSVNPTEVLVEVTVDKGAIRGFGKLQETIPSGFSAVAQATDEAIFTTQDRTVKFVWLNLPAKTTLTISYKLRSNGLPEADYTVNGEFGYLLNDETQKAVIGSSTFKLGLPTPDSRPVAATEPPKEPSTPVSVPAVQVPTRTEEPATARTEEPKPAKQPTSAPPVTAQANGGTKSRIPSPEVGITYKVQITAAHREVGSPYFQKRHRYSGDFIIERHQGWIKYVTGRYDQYAEARSQRDTYVATGHNFPGPFVTAYNNGERITVQEALMISNQRSAQ